MKFIAVWYEEDTPTTMYVEAADLKGAFIYIFEKKILEDTGIYKTIEDFVLDSNDLNDLSSDIIDDIDFFEGYFDSLDYEAEGFLGTILDAETGQIVYDYFDED